MIDVYQSQLDSQGELYLRIKVRPGSPVNAVREIMSDNTLKIDVAAAPEKNRANQALMSFLADIFGVDKAKVRILAGAGEKTKLVKISK
jgi:uncharacterized protein YggU (UPF0235/DUF167 family)